MERLLKHQLKCLLYLVSLSLGLLLTSCSWESYIKDFSEKNYDISYELTKIETQEEIPENNTLMKFSIGMGDESDFQDTAAIKITVIDVRSQPKSNFTPEIRVIGASQITANCEKTGDDGISHCILKSKKRGKYLITLGNAVVRSHVEVSFFAKNDIELLRGTALANGQDEVSFKVILRNALGKVEQGMRPHLKMVFAEGLQKSDSYACTLSNENGVAHCALRSSKVGTYNVTFDAPLSDTIYKVDFFEAVINPKDNYAKIDPNGDNADGVTNPDAQVPIEVKLPDLADGQPNVGTVPVLEIGPGEGSSYHCEPSDATGVSKCYITSSVPGDKTIQVTEPTGIDDVIKVTFGDGQSTVNPPADPDKEYSAGSKDGYPIEITWKDSDGNPVVGAIPEGEVVGPGNNQMDCGPTNAQGVATCYITTDTPGSKEVNFTNPILEPIEVEFKEPTVEIVNDKAEAGNGDQNLITIVTRDEDGNIVTDVTPKLEITGPGESEYICSPSDQNGVARCYITAEESGEFKVEITSPEGSKETVDLIFADYHSSANLTKAIALADLTDSAILKLSIFQSSLIPKVGFVPNLRIGGHGYNTHQCDPTNILGQTECRIQSDTWGDKSVEVIHPHLKQNYVVHFLNPYSKILESYPGSLVSYANASNAFAEIRVELKKNASLPLAGFIPKLEMPSANLSYTCTATDTNGVGKCTVRSAAIGKFTVSLLEPKVSTPGLELNFLNKVRNCSVDFGEGTQEWTGPGFDEFSACENLNCAPGYSVDGGMCKEFDAPQGGGFSINSGAQGTASSWVDLSIDYPSDESPPLYMSFSEDVNTFSTWMPIAATKNFNLSSGDGLKTVYLKFKDRFDNISEVHSQTIRLDTRAPVGGAFSITNNGNHVVGSPSLDIVVQCPVDISGGVQSALDKTTQPRNWVNCISSMDFLLESVSGQHDLYMPFRDGLNNITPDYRASVILDITGPTTSVSYLNGYLNSSNTTGVTVNAVDDYSSVAGCMLQYQESTLTNGVEGIWSGWMPVLRTGNGCGDQGFVGELGKAYRFRARSVDEWSHTGDYLQSGSVLKIDTTAPIGGSIVNPTINQTTTPIALQLNKGSDPESGMSPSGSEYTLAVRSATNVDGVCQSNWTAYAPLPSPGTSASANFVGVQGKCYHFQYTVTNGAGLKSTYETSSPSRIDYTYAWSIGGWNGCTAPNGTFSYGGWGGCSASPYWSVGGWGSCSRLCGYGTQSRSVTCVGTSGTQTRGASCVNGTGTEYRTVVCIRSDGAQVVDGYCGSKPATAQACSRPCVGSPITSQGCSVGCSGGAPASSQSCYGSSCGDDGYDGGDDGDDGAF